MWQRCVFVTWPPVSAPSVPLFPLCRRRYFYNRTHRPAVEPGRHSTQVKPHCKNLKHVRLAARVTRTSRSRRLPGRPPSTSRDWVVPGSATETAWARSAANHRSARGGGKGMNCIGGEPAGFHCFTGWTVSISGPGVVSLAGRAAAQQQAAALSCRGRNSSVNWTADDQRAATEARPDIS